MKSHFAASSLIAPCLLALLLCGCYSEVSHQTVTTATGYRRKWLPAISLDQAQSLSADEAKAILIARAAVEQANLRQPEPPAILSLTPERDGTGWRVHVTFVGLYNSDGTPMPGPGYFCVVHIDKDWHVSGITGGA